MLLGPDRCSRGSTSPLRSYEPEFWLAQGFLKGFIDSWSLQHQARRKVSLEKYISQSILLGPFPVLTLPFAVEINIVIYQRGSTQASSPSRMFCKVILTADIWEPPYWVKKIISFLCICLHSNEDGERRGEGPIKIL